MVVSSDIDQLPHGAMLGATIGTFAVASPGWRGGPAREKGEVLAAFAAHKGEVTEGSMASA
jgi:hypothetical protein